jgi:hypothetical protein
MDFQFSPTSFDWISVQQVTSDPVLRFRKTFIAKSAKREDAGENVFSLDQAGRKIFC